MSRSCTKPKWTHVHWKQYCWKGDWLCSKFTYKYQKRSEHDFLYISKLVFLDARQPAKPPLSSLYRQTTNNLSKPLILTPHSHPGAPINYERFLIYSSRIHNWNSICIKLDWLSWVEFARRDFLSDRKLNASRFDFNIQQSIITGFLSVWDIVTNETMDLAKQYVLIAVVLWLLLFETGKDLCSVVCKFNN